MSVLVFKIGYFLLIFRDDGGCKHVVALLFALVVWGERHTDRYTETCTDVKCVWDNPRRESKPRKMDEISMSKRKECAHF